MRSTIKHVEGVLCTSRTFNSVGLRVSWVVSQPAPQSASQERDRLVLSIRGHFGLPTYICMYYRRSQVAMLPSLDAQPMQHYDPEQASYEARHGVVIGPVEEDDDVCAELCLFSLQIHYAFGSDYKLDGALHWPNKDQPPVHLRASMRS